MSANNAKFEVELYYERAFPPVTAKPEHWDMTVAEGGNLYLEDKQNDHPNLPHYNFRVTRIAADGVTLDQIPDRRGEVQQFDRGSAKEQRCLLEPGKTLRIRLNVPGGGPVWTVTWSGLDGTRD